MSRETQYFLLACAKALWVQSSKDSAYEKRILLMRRFSGFFCLFVLAAANSGIMAADLPRGDVTLDLKGAVKTIENWEWDKVK